MLDNIRIRAGKRILKKELAKKINRSGKVTNLNQANSVALLYKITSEESLQHLQKFAKYLKSEFGIKKIFMLGYWDDPKNEPEYLQAKIDFDFFSKKELNWFGIPNGSKIRNFLNEDFDILIDLNNYYNVPLRYIIVKSRAKLKVGRNHIENEPFFDLLIANNKVSFEEYCNELIKYLTMLNP